MGVPKLWAFVHERNLGVKKSFPRRSKESCEEFEPLNLIFDGPSFAYWLWRQASVKKGTLAFRG
jgi:hypothetical protein